VADHDVGACIDRRMGDLRHVLQNVLAQSPVARRHQHVDAGTKRRDILLEPSQIGRVRPGDDVGRNAGTVGRRHPDARLEHRHVVGGVAANDGDAGRVLARLVIGRPIDRAALQKAEANAFALQDDRHTGGREVGAGAGVLDAQLIQARNRHSNIRIAIVHVVGDADGMNPGKLQRLAADGRIREETLIAGRVPRRRVDQAAFEIAEHHVGPAQLVADKGKRRFGIGDVHEVHVTGEDHPQRHRITLATRTAGPRDRTRIIPAHDVSELGRAVDAALRWPDRRSRL
jgi:hypothetical protein